MTASAAPQCGDDALVNSPVEDKPLSVVDSFVVGKSGYVQIAVYHDRVSFAGRIFSDDPGASPVSGIKEPLWEKLTVIVSLQSAKWVALGFVPTNVVATRGSRGPRRLTDWPTSRWSRRRWLATTPGLRAGREVLS